MLEQKLLISDAQFGLSNRNAQGTSIDEVVTELKEEIQLLK